MMASLHHFIPLISLYILSIDFTHGSFNHYSANQGGSNYAPSIPKAAASSSFPTAAASSHNGYPSISSASLHPYPAQPSSNPIYSAPSSASNNQYTNSVAAQPEYGISPYRSSSASSSSSADSSNRYPSAEINDFRSSNSYKPLTSYESADNRISVSSVANSGSDIYNKPTLISPSGPTSYSSINTKPREMLQPTHPVSTSSSPESHSRTNSVAPSFHTSYPNRAYSNNSRQSSSSPPLSVRPSIVGSSDFNIPRHSHRPVSGPHAVSLPSTLPYSSPPAPSFSSPISSSSASSATHSDPIGATGHTGSVGSLIEYHCEPPSIPQPSSSFLNQPNTLIARIHSAGYHGYALFAGDSASASLLQVHVHVSHGRSTSGQAPREAFSWRIYDTHTINTEGGCTAYLGSQPLLHDLTLALGPVVSGRPTQLRWNLAEEAASGSSNDPNQYWTRTLLGKTLLLLGAESGVKICATILPAGPKRVFDINLHQPIAGRLQLVQPVNGAVAALMSEYLMYSNGERKESRHRWQLVEALLPSSKDPSVEASERYHQEITACNDLRGKYLLSAQQSVDANPLTVNTEMPSLRGRSSLYLDNLKPLSEYGAYFLLLYDGINSDKILACAPLLLQRPKQATALFKTSPVLGKVTLRQESSLEPTEVRAQLNFTSNSAFFYGVDALPSIKRRKPELRRCPNIRESIFNPLHVDGESVPFEAQGTADQYAVGDLSGKFCSIPPSSASAGQQQRLQLQLLDHNLPLFGSRSVLGRALVFYEPDGAAATCANLELDNEAMNTAYATFDQPVQGQFIFRQSATDCDEQVFVYVEISKPDTLNAMRSENHAWHVHEKSVKTGFDALSTTQCSAAGSHHNPFNVTLDATYLRDCTVSTAERCERGDTSSKLGPISISPYKPSSSALLAANGQAEPEVSKYYFVDRQLSLCGPNSIVGRSVVVHDKHFEMTRLSCSNILEFKPKQ